MGMASMEEDIQERRDDGIMGSLATVIATAEDGYVRCKKCHRFFLVAMVERHSALCRGEQITVAKVTKRATKKPATLKPVISTPVDTTNRRGRYSHFDQLLDDIRSDIRAVQEPDGWTRLSRLEAKVYQRFGSLNFRPHGYKNLLALLRDWPDVFVLKFIKNQYYIAPKQRVAPKHSQTPVAVQAKPPFDNSKLRKLLADAFNAVSPDGSPVRFSALYRSLTLTKPGFHPHKFNAKTLSELLVSVPGEFKIFRSTDEDGITYVYVARSS